MQQYAQTPGFGQYMQPGYPYQSPQQRLQTLEQMYPYLAPQPVQPPPAPPLKGRPVSGIDEAKAAQIDFDGSLHVFTDVANGRVYTKQLGQTGLVEFNTYVMQVPAPEPQPVDATADLREKVAALETKINQWEEVIQRGNQSNADNKPAAKQRKPDSDSPADSGK